jgi:hypothetical protein
MQRTRPAIIGLAAVLLSVPASLAAQGTIAD